ncbi:MAG: hypothetical protein HC935_06445 [Pseudanabaena sp. SU_2_4]|nr:hypothetical protein [Pseudanabaena sp. SU_2_4]
MPLEWAMILIDLHGDRFRKTACAILNALNGVPGSKKTPPRPPDRSHYILKQIPKPICAWDQ